MKRSISVKRKIDIRTIISKSNIVFAFLLLLIIGAIRYPSFLSSRNIYNLIRQSSMLGIMAIGMSFVILQGGIDLSVAPVFAMAGVVIALLSRFSIGIGILVALVIAILLGALNGILVAKLKVVPFIATLGVMMAVRGVLYVITEQRPVKVEMTTWSTFNQIAQKDILGIPLPFIIFMIILIIATLVLRYSIFGRNVYSVGGNEEAANILGLNVARVRIITYIICSFLSALAGIVMTSRLGMAQPIAAEGWEMYAIAAVAMGGIPLTGGIGKVYGTFFGVLIIGMIQNMINLEGTLDASWQSVIMGFALLFSVLFTQIQKSKFRRRKLQKKLL